MKTIEHNLLDKALLDNEELFEILSELMNERNIFVIKNKLLTIIQALGDTLDDQKHLRRLMAKTMAKTGR